MARDEPERRLEKVVFVAAGQAFRWLDVLLAADVRGEWAAFEATLQRDSAGDRKSAAEIDLEGALTDFRRREGLLTAEDMEAWLERFDLDAGDWRRAVHRAVLRDRLDTEMRSAESIASGAPLPVRFQTFWADAVVSGALQVWARRAAEDVALVTSRSGDSAAGGAGAPLEAEGAAPVPPLLSRDAASRREWFVRIAEKVRAIEDGIVTAPATRSALISNALEWTRVVLELVWFPAEAVAREALLCHRIEGEALASVAERSGGRRQEVRCRLEELAPELHARSVSGQPGQVLGPLPWERGFALLRIVERHPPHLEDPESLAHARRHLLGALRQRAVWDHVRFLLPVTEAG